MNRILLIEVSTERGIVGIVQDGKILFLAELPFGMQNSTYLLPEIQRGLVETGLSLSQLTLIAVGVGPGSYTGIRVGATAAKALSFASRIPLVGVCSLDTFIPEQSGPFASVIDAKIGGIYWQAGIKENGKVVFEGGPQITPLSTASEMLAKYPVLVTPNAIQLRSKLNAAEWTWVESYPSVLQLAARAEEKFLRGEVSVDGELELLYMRKTQAEIEREQRKSNVLD